MKFKKNNKIKFFQDFKMHEGIPDKIEFKISDFNENKIFLTAKGYGAVPNYGNGSLGVDLSEFSVRDRILIEKEFNALNKPCCSCTCGDKCS